MRHWRCLFIFASLFSFSHFFPLHFSFVAGQRQWTRPKEVIVFVEAQTIIIPHNFTYLRLLTAAASKVCRKCVSAWLNHTHTHTHQICCTVFHYHHVEPPSELMRCEVEKYCSFPARRVQQSNMCACEWQLEMTRERAISLWSAFVLKSENVYFDYW